MLFDWSCIKTVAKQQIANDDGILFVQYKQVTVAESCERWLEVNVVPQVWRFSAVHLQGLR